MDNTEKSKVVTGKCWNPALPLYPTADGLERPSYVDEFERSVIETAKESFGVENVEVYKSCLFIFTRPQMAVEFHAACSELWRVIKTLAQRQKGEGFVDERGVVGGFSAN
jgi:hypothetical protein